MTRRTDKSHRAYRAAFLVHIGENDLGAGTCKGNRRRLTHPNGGSRDDRNPASQDSVLRRWRRRL
jgi:hypothetical protein